MGQKEDHARGTCCRLDIVSYVVVPSWLGTIMNHLRICVPVVKLVISGTGSFVMQCTSGPDMPYFT